MILILKIGGIYNILCALLHVMFPKMLGWEKILPSIPDHQRPFVRQPLYIMNWCLALFWVILAYIPIFYADQMLTTGLGKSLLAAIVIFWLIRIFVLQPVYIGMKSAESRKMTGFFLVGLILFAVPLMGSL